MLTKPSDIFRSEVAPALEEYLADPLNERRAKNVAKAIDHHLEWTFIYYEREDPSRLAGTPTLPAFREQLFNQCPELRLMWDLADASRHRFLTRPSVPPRTLTSSTAAFIPQTTGLWVNNYNQPFGSAITTAVEFWSRWPD